MKDLCYVYIQTKNEVGIVRRGETGYYKTDLAQCNNIKSISQGIAFVDELNEKLGLTKGEVHAMEAGSMFGWDVPAADPSRWNDDGTVKKWEGED